MIGIDCAANPLVGVFFKLDLIGIAVAVVCVVLDFSRFSISGEDSMPEGVEVLSKFMNSSRFMPSDIGSSF